MNPMKNREKMIEVSEPNLVLLIGTLICRFFKGGLAELSNWFEVYSIAYLQIFKTFCQKGFKNK